MQPKKQLKVQYIGIFEEIDSFYWLKLLFQNKRLCNDFHAFLILLRSALFKDDPVPRQGPTMATIDGRGKYKIPQNIFTSILTLKVFSLILLRQSEPDMFSEMCPPPSTIPIFTKSSTVWINHFPQNWR